MLKFDCDDEVANTNLEHPVSDIERKPKKTSIKTQQTLDLNESLQKENTNLLLKVQDLIQLIFAKINSFNNVNNDQKYATTLIWNVGEIIHSSVEKIKGLSIDQKRETLIFGEKRPLKRKLKTFKKNQKVKSTLQRQIKKLINENKSLKMFRNYVIKSEKTDKVAKNKNNISRFRKLSHIDRQTILNTFDEIRYMEKFRKTHVEDLRNLETNFCEINKKFFRALENEQLEYKKLKSKMFRLDREMKELRKENEYLNTENSVLNRNLARHKRSGRETNGQTYKRGYNKYENRRYDDSSM